MTDETSSQSFRFGFSHDYKPAKRPNAPPDLKLISPYFISDTVKSSRNPYTGSTPVSASSSVRRCFCNTRYLGQCTCVSSTSTSPMDTVPRHFDNPLAMHSPASQTTSYHHQVLGSPVGSPPRTSSLVDQGKSFSRAMSESALKDTSSHEDYDEVVEPEGSVECATKKHEDSSAGKKRKLFGSVRGFKKTLKSIWTQGDDSDPWRYSTYRS